MSQTSNNKAAYLSLSIIFFVLIAPMLAYMAWCVYDATVHYPDLIQRWETFEQVRLDHPDNFRDEWAAVASSNGWPTELPEETDPMMIVTQYVQIGFCSLISLVFGVLGIVFLCLSLKKKPNAA